MKRWEYSKGWKALALILNQVCAVVLVLSIAVCMVSVGNSGFRLFKEDDVFENTAYFQREAREQIFRCVRAASRESRFEKNGVYDASLVLNIQEYADENQILHTKAEDGGLCYKLTDLLNWSLDGCTYNTLLKITYDDGRIGYISKSSKDYTEQAIYDDGTAVASVSISYDAALSFIEESLEEVSEETMEETFIPEGELEEPELFGEGIFGQAVIQDVEEIQAVEERYAPAEYTDIISYAEAQKLSTQELQEIYASLEHVLNNIYNDYYSYKENLELFSPSMTNMRYLVIPEEVTQVTKEDYEQKTITNIKSFGKTELADRNSLLDYIRSHGDYLIFNSSDMSYEMNQMPVSLSEISSYLKEFPMSVEGNYTLAIAIDPSYVASDNLQMYKRQYEEIQPISRMSVYGVILGGILYLLTLIYLTLAAGRGTEEEDRSIGLTRFDRIRTEGAALLLLLPTWLITFAGTLMHNRVNGLGEAGVFGGVITFLLNFLFLCGYLSLVRRIKTRTLWKNSVLYAVLKHFYRMVGRWKVTTKVMLSYGMFLLVNMLLFFFGSLGIMLLVIFDFAAGLILLQQARQRKQILEGIRKISEGDLNYQIPIEKLSGDSLLLAEAVNHIGEGLSTAVEQSVKDERLKTDLITNVSHDIKTPLTSIINYVDLLKREDIPNERARNYIAILEDKSQRLKHLTDDLVEASKISSGNVKLELVRINFQELINQTNGEFSEKFEERELQLVVNMPREPVIIEADGRRLWRIIENLYGNVAKYAMPGTRVYVELTVVGHMVRFHIKNISEQPLNIDAGELTERFIRGDVARSTEGSGLGLSITKTLTELQKGSFDIYLDGDLFKVTIIFPEAPRTEAQGQNPADSAVEDLGAPGLKEQILTE
ncbi:MAG: HAMP domain-containing histidine kinase [Lachnospiraceae bacterium]|jgi:signal transduction histidine kinase|nr:HAMP domain-containing histidine kinase [Lachnospiraceae bacterium]